MYIDIYYLCVSATEGTRTASCNFWTDWRKSVLIICIILCLAFFTADFLRFFFIFEITLILFLTFFSIFWDTKELFWHSLVVALLPFRWKKTRKDGKRRIKDVEKTCFISASTIAKACWTGKSSGNYCIEQRNFTLFIFLYFFPPSSLQINASMQKYKMQNCIYSFSSRYISYKGQSLISA